MLLLLLPALFVGAVVTVVLIFGDSLIGRWAGIWKQAQGKQKQDVK